MQFRKLAAVAGSALMAGMAIAAPVMASTVSQVNKISDMVSSTNFPMFVVGASAKTEDVAGAVDMAVKLASYSKTTEEVAATASTTEAVTGGVKIQTPGTELIPWTSMQTTKPILTKSDMSILDTSSYSTSTGGSYQYKQYLYIGGETADTAGAMVKFERPTTENDPRLGLKTPASKILYTYKLTFSTPVSLSSVTTTATLQTLIQGTTLTMLGKDFVVSDCTYSSATQPISDMTLLGGKNVVTVKSGEDKTVTVDAKDYVVHLDGVGSETVGGTTYYAAIGDVNGESFSMRAGQTATLSDGTIIAGIKVLLGKTGEPDFAKIAIGADKIKLTFSTSAGVLDGTVAKGTTTISTLAVGLTASASAGWASLSYKYTPSVDAWIKEGEKITDPLSEAFDIKFNSMYPEFTDTTNRQTITLAPSGYNMLLTYKNQGGAEKQAYTIYYSSTASSTCMGYNGNGTTTNYCWAASGAGSPTNYDNNWRDLVFDESYNISAIEQDYFVIQKSGFSHVMQFTSFSPATSELIFTDEAGNSITSSNTSATGGSLIVDGNSFNYNLTGCMNEPMTANVGACTYKKIAIDLNGDGYLSSTSCAAGACAYTPLPGAEYSFLVPEKITSGKGGLYFYTGDDLVNLAAAQTWYYPRVGFAGIRLLRAATTNVTTVATYSAGTWTNETTTMVAPFLSGDMTNVSYTKNYIDYQVNCGNLTGATTIKCWVGLGESIANLRTSPGVILVQEALQGTETHNWVYFPVTWDSTNSRTYITTPRSDDSNYDPTAAKLATSTEYTGLTTYGTKIDYLSSQLGGKATISYPDSFTYANVYVMGPAGTVTSTTTGGTATTTDKVVAVTADIVKLDSEITSADKSSYDLVLVGGPCVNTLVASLATEGKFDYKCDSWPAKNFGIIKLVNDAFATGKTSLVVAGTRAADTDLASRVVQDGTKLEGITKASAEVTGESFSSVVVA